MSIHPGQNLAVIWILAGIFLIYAELNRPGTVLLGCFGTFMATLGCYGLAQHSVRVVPFVLLVVSASLLLLELRVRMHGLFALAVTAVVVWALASLTQPTIDPVLAFVAGSLFTLVTVPLLRIARRARQNKRLGHSPAPNLQPSRGSLAE